MDIIEEIKKLKSLLNQGAISEEEFDQLKKSLIGSQYTSEQNKEQVEHLKIPILKRKWIIVAIIILSIIVIIGISYQKVIKEIAETALIKDSTNNTNQNYKKDNVISEDEEEMGTLIIKKFILDKNNNGLILSIPKGKIWIPLYFEEESSDKDCYHIPIPKVFIDRETKTGWNKSTSFYLIDKKKFVSYKLSKANNKAVSGEICVMCIQRLCERVNYIVYFLEE